MILLTNGIPIILIKKKKCSLVRKMVPGLNLSQAVKGRRDPIRLCLGQPSAQPWQGPPLERAALSDRDQSVLSWRPLCTGGGKREHVITGD